MNNGFNTVDIIQDAYLIVLSAIWAFTTYTCCVSRLHKLSTCSSRMIQKNVCFYFKNRVPYLQCGAVRCNRGIFVSLRTRNEYPSPPPEPSPKSPPPLRYLEIGDDHLSQAGWSFADPRIIVITYYYYYYNIACQTCLASACQVFGIKHPYYIIVLEHTAQLQQSVPCLSSKY